MAVHVHIKVGVAKAYEELASRLEKAIAEFPKYEEWAMKLMAIAVLDKIKKDISSSSVSPAMTPLSHKWATYKAKHKLHPQIMMATGDYMGGLHKVKIKRGWAIVGNKELASLHEEGSSKIPARPHWAPTITAILDGPVIQQIAKAMAICVATGKAPTLGSMGGNK